MTSSTTPWEFPAAYYLLIVTFTVIGGHWLLLLNHLWNCHHESTFEFKVQALGVRICGILPVICVLATITAYWPVILEEVEIAYAFLEAYIILLFFALFTSLGFARTKTPPGYLEHIKSHPATSRLVRFLGDSNWNTFRTGEGSLRFWRNLCLQFIVVKPITAIIAAIIVSRNGGILPPAVAIVLRVIGILSIVFALVALFRIYRATVSGEGRPFQGENVVRKFFIVKFIFFFVIVINNLILKSLLSSGRMAIPAWLCEEAVYVGSEVDKEHCKTRVVEVALIFECLLVALPAVSRCCCCCLLHLLIIIVHCLYGKKARSTRSGWKK